MEHRRTRFSYPVFLDLHGVVVLVVGGGRVGARKAAGLLDAGAVVRLVATEVGDDVDRELIATGGGGVHERPFDAGDLDGVRLVVTATGHTDTDADVAAAARRRGIWVNAADQPADCDFILPAIVRAGRVTGAISTDGASPALAGHLRDELRVLLGDDVAHAADVLAAERAAVRRDGRSTEDIDWAPRIDALLGRRG